MEIALWWSVAFIFGSVIFKFAATKSNEYCKMRMLCTIQQDIAQAQLYSQWKTFRRWSTGDLLVRAQKDTQEVVQMIVQTFPNFTLTIIRLLASVSLLWVFDSRLAIVVFCITPLFIFSKIFYKNFRKLTSELKKTESELSHVFSENLKLRVLIMTLGVESQRLKKLFNVQEQILQIKTKILHFSLLSQTSVKSVVSIGFLITFVWSVLGLYAGTISFGMMTAFLQLVGRVQNPMIGLLGFFPSFISFGVSIDRIQDVLAAKDKSDEIQSYYLTNLSKIKLRNVSFRYEECNVLENLNLTLIKGESTAIIGASGRGKTTLIRLLLSVIKPDHGKITILYNDKEEELTEKFKMNFGFVPQGDKLFSGSIRENLLINDSLVTDEKIDQALYNACAEFVYNLPQGVDTIIGESGYGLSEGQAQRIAIARTLLYDKPIWLFDEITSALDSTTAFLLMQRLKKISNDKITVFVTHDMNLASNCDQIYFMS